MYSDKSSVMTSAPNSWWGANDDKRRKFERTLRDMRPCHVRACSGANVFSHRWRFDSHTIPQHRHLHSQVHNAKRPQQRLPRRIE